MGSIALLLFACGVFLTMFSEGRQFGQKLIFAGLGLAFILPGILIALRPAMAFAQDRPWLWVLAGIVLLLLAIARVSGKRPRSRRASAEVSASPKRRVDLPALHAGDDEGDE